MTKNIIPSNSTPDLSKAAITAQTRTLGRMGIDLKLLTDIIDAAKKDDDT